MWPWRQSNLIVEKKQKLAYVFAIVGNVTNERVAEHLAAIELLKKSGAQIEIVSMQTPNNVIGLVKGLQQLKVTPRFVSSFRGPCKNSPQFRFEATYDIFHIWNLTEHHKILYLDNDLAVRSSPDSIFKLWASQSTTELRTPIGCSRPDRNALVTGYNTGVWGTNSSRLNHNLRHFDAPCSLSSPFAHTHASHIHTPGHIGTAVTRLPQRASSLRVWDELEALKLKKTFAKHSALAIRPTFILR